jgi:GT2 family glycosyltransferase/glycosyltransferase involved in cell wall biosynthesis
LSLDAAGCIPGRRGGVVVCIPVHGAHDEFVACLRSVLAHTDENVPLLIADDASPDERSRRFVEELEIADVLAHDVYYVCHPENGGFVPTINDAFTRTAPADVVVVNSDCVVTAGWLDRMIAAREDTLVATVSVFTNHGTILSLPHRNRPQPALPQTISLDDAARTIAAGSLRSHPRIPTVVGHCFLVKRAALELVGPFDLAFSPGYGEEVDFAQRCLLHGLSHVVADDVFVLHCGSASFGVDGVPNLVKEAHDRKIAVRYPYFYDWVDDFSIDVATPFARAIGAAERAWRPITVTVDGRCLTPILTGTQVHALEVVAALSRRGGTQLRVAVPPVLGDYARAILDSLANVETFVVSSPADVPKRSDVVHRPFQVSSEEDLDYLDAMGERIVLTHQDLIGFNNPGYARSYRDWMSHRRLTRYALALADQVVFMSRTAADEAISEELVERERVHVVHIGTDHSLDGLEAEETSPPGIDRLTGRPFLICLGTDFVHKNRVFALRVLQALREHEGWDGGLVLAGPHVQVGSSASEEAAFLALHPDLADDVVDVAAVDEGAKRWLLRHAAMMIYPSVYEGFGLVPFEAADAGLACAWAPQTSIAELLPTSLALLEPWDAEASAGRIAPLLASPQLRAQHVAGVRAAAAPLTWNRTANLLSDVYIAAASRPPSEVRKLVVSAIQERREIEAEHERFRELEQRYRALTSAFDKNAEGLVGPQGLIPQDLRRPLLALASRRALRTPLFGMLRLLYRSGYRLRHRGRGPS